MTANPNPYASPQSDTLSPGEAWLAGGAGNLNIVCWGLALIYWGILLLVLGVVVIIAGAFIDGRPQGFGPSLNAPVATAGFGMLLLAAIFWFVGPLLCLPAPTAGGARALIIASVVMQLSGYVVNVLPEMGGIVTIAGTLLSWGGMICFLLFLRQLSLFIAQPNLAARAMRILIGGVVLAAMAMVTPWAGILGIPLGIVGLVLVFGGLLVFLSFANLVNDLRKKLRSHLAPSPTKAALANEHHVVDRDYRVGTSSAACSESAATG